MSCCAAANESAPCRDFADDLYRYFSGIDDFLRIGGIVFTSIVYLSVFTASVC